MIVTGGNESNYTPVSAGTHTAVCYGVVGIGTQVNKQFNTKHKQLIILWEIADEFNDNGDPKVMSKIYTASIGEKATLRKDLESWRGKAFNADELKGFEMMNILGKSCFLTIIEEERNGKKYSNIFAVSAIPKGMAKEMDTVHDCFMFDATETTYPNEEYGKLPEWIQKKIAESVEWADEE